MVQIKTYMIGLTASSHMRQSSMWESPPYKGAMGWLPAQQAGRTRACLESLELSHLLGAMCTVVQVLDVTSCAIGAVAVGLAFSTCRHAAS